MFLQIGIGWLMATSSIIRCFNCRSIDWWLHHSCVSLVHHLSAHLSDCHSWQTKCFYGSIRVLANLFVQIFIDFNLMYFQFKWFVFGGDSPWKGISNLNRSTISNHHITELKISSIYYMAWCRKFYSTDQQNMTCDLFINILFTPHQSSYQYCL